MIRENRFTPAETAPQKGKIVTPPINIQALLGQDMDTPERLTLEHDNIFFVAVNRGTATRYVGIVDRLVGGYDLFRLLDHVAPVKNQEDERDGRYEVIGHFYYLNQLYPRNVELTREKLNDPDRISGGYLKVLHRTLGRDWSTFRQHHHRFLRALNDLTPGEDGSGLMPATVWEKTNICGNRNMLLAR